MNRKTNVILFVLVLLVAGYMTFFRTPSGMEKPAETASAESAKKLLHITADDVTGLLITPADDKPLAIEKKGGSWQITQPFNARAEKTVADDLLLAITDLTSRGQLDLKDPKAADHGLDHPRYRIEITTKDGKTAKLAIGSRSPLGDTMLVQLDGNANADVVPADLYQKLAEPANKFRDTRLTDALAADIKQIILTNAAGQIVLQKTGDTWQMTQPQKMAIEPSEATDITAQLSNLRAVDFVNEDGAGVARYQLSDPQLTAFFSKEAPATQPAAAATQPAGVTLKIGRYDGPQKQNVYAQLSTSPGVVKVSAVSLNTLRKKPYELRDRKAVDIDPATVSRISLTTDTPATTQPTTREASKSTLTLVQNEQANLQGPPTPTTTPAATQSASRWIFADYRKNSADDAKVTDLLAFLKPLRATRYLETMPEAKGATTYALTLTTIAAGGAATTHELRIVDRGETDVPVAQYNGLVFEVDRDLLAKLNLR